MKRIKPETHKCRFCGRENRVERISEHGRCVDCEIELERLRKRALQPKPLREA